MSGKEFFIFGRKPIADLMRTGKLPDKILLLKTATGDEIKEILTLAQQYEVPVQRVPREKLDALTGKYSRYREANHQGVVAFLPLIQYYTIEDAINAAYQRKENPLFVLLDGVTDIGNFGAIARSAECFGAHAIIVPTQGSAQINADAMKTSAGALNKILVCREKSLITAVKYLKLSGIKVYAAALKQSVPLATANFDIPAAIVLGNEGDGISDAVLKLCDEAIRIPMSGTTESLNVSVSAGVILYEIHKQRNHN